MAKMSKNLEKSVKMWNTLKKESKMSKNLEKTVKNVKKPGENHEKY